ncbi:Dyp-type peroxidase [Actinophytocola glycyrrhizae]|uniref:Dyp-type peroxidase n=1 Tax=Actinophytocola glycyrrhizae TaxID=2044873 RepID=A0ABV9S049_9PSEU
MTTPVLPETEFVAFDVTTPTRAALADALQALITPITGATTTIAVGASLFDGRFDLERPSRLIRMPTFRNDVLDLQWCHGDLLVQLGTEHRAAIEPFLASRPPHLTSRWRITGNHRERNLFGFTEGAGNPDPNDDTLMNQHVWVQPGDDEPAWCIGGTYQVVRLIQLAMPTWDAEPVNVQEKVFGRTKNTDAPLGQSTRDADPDYRSDPSGTTIPLDAHIRRANPHTPESKNRRILRHSHTYRRSPDNVGQVFVCFQRDLERGFATIQRRLAGEALEKYLLPFGGGYYFVLPDPADLIASLRKHS